MLNEFDLVEGAVPPLNGESCECGSPSFSALIAAGGCAFGCGAIAGMYFMGLSWEDLTALVAGLLW